jgi:hypothetical protein
MKFSKLVAVAWILLVFACPVVAHQEVPCHEETDSCRALLKKFEKEQSKAKKKNAKVNKKWAEWSAKLDAIQAEFPTLTREQAAKIAKHEIWIGMTVPMLERSWVGPLGPVQPIRVNNSYGPNGTQQQAVYETFGKRIYVYIDNGVVTSYQVEDR